MIPPKRFFMIRHGEAEANVLGLAAGALDTPLTDLGKSQAASARAIIERLDPRPLKIVTSPLTRTRQTAGILNESLSLPLSVCADIAEYRMGDWEGDLWSDVEARLKQGIEPPNGETRAFFYSRIVTAITEQLAETDHLTLFVAHGGVLRALSSALSYEITDIPNCGLFGFEPPSRAKPHWGLARLDETGPQDLSPFLVQHAAASWV